MQEGGKRPGATNNEMTGEGKGDGRLFSLRYRQSERTTVGHAQQPFRRGVHTPSIRGDDMQDMQRFPLYFGYHRVFYRDTPLKPYDFGYAESLYELLPA